MVADVEAFQLGFLNRRGLVQTVTDLASLFVIVSKSCCSTARWSSNCDRRC